MVLWQSFSGRRAKRFQLRHIWRRVAVLVASMGLALVLASCATGVQTISDPSVLPADVRAWFDTYARIDVVTSATFGRYTYLLAAWGRQEDQSGPAITIDKVDTSGETVVARVHYTPGVAANGAVSYPFALVRFPATWKQVWFESPDREYLPRAVGVPAGFHLLTSGGGVNVVYDNTTSPNILIGTSAAQLAPGTMLVEGIARVFEATVNYDVLSPNGTVLGTNNVMAASGGPDWGYFSINLPGREYTRGVRVYWVSPKDGEKMDIVTVTWGE